MLESAMVLYHDEIVSVTKGRPATVEFDFETVWDFKRKTPNFSARHLTWVHVHPTGFGTQPSTTDENCAQGLFAAFGRLEQFGIICFSSPTFKNIEGLISWYRFDPVTSKLIKTAEHDLQDDRYLIEEEVAMLKALSYGDLWISPSMALERLVLTSSSN